jgi:transcriptional regulator with XRE-family HTH domain
MTPAQCRAARALLGWSQDELGERARVAQKTITKFESEARVPHPRTVEALAKALEDAGILFLEATEIIVVGVAVRVGSEAAKKLGASGSGADDDDERKASSAMSAGTLL